MSESADKQELQWATAKQLPADASLSAVGAELREGWLALTECLPRAADDNAFAAQMARELAAVPCVERRDRQSSRWISAAIAVATVAAVILLAVSFWPEEAPSRKLPANTIAAEKANHTSPIGTAGIAQASADWDDPLDADLLDMQSHLSDLTADAPQLDLSLSAFDRRLAELADELSAGSL